MNCHTLSDEEWEARKKRFREGMEFVTDKKAPCDFFVPPDGCKNPRFIGNAPGEFGACYWRDENWRCGAYRESREWAVAVRLMKDW